MQVCSGRLYVQGSSFKAIRRYRMPTDCISGSEVQFRCWLMVLGCSRFIPQRSQKQLRFPWICGQSSHFEPEMMGHIVYIIIINYLYIHTGNCLFVLILITAHDNLWAPLDS